MTFNDMYNTAVDVVSKLPVIDMSGMQTVCVIQSISGRLYTGVSHIEQGNGGMIEIHAEVEALRIMQSAGESVVGMMVLIRTSDRAPMLPCVYCIAQILSLAPENAGSLLAMPDRLIRLADMPIPPGLVVPQPQVMPQAQPMPQMQPQVMPQAQPMPQMQPQAIPQPQPMPQAQPDPTPQPEEPKAPESLLKSRISNIMGAVDDDDDDDEELIEELSGKKKKGLFGLFG